ncbi:unnamed protein product [Camellia sinensis]
MGPVAAVGAASCCRCVVHSGRRGVFTV